MDSWIAAPFFLLRLRLQQLIHSKENQLVEPREVVPNSERKLRENGELLEISANEWGGRGGDTVVNGGDEVVVAIGSAISDGP